jgi:hypothetical protein
MWTAGEPLGSRLLARSGFNTAGDWLNLRSPRSKLYLAPSLSGIETGFYNA